jgi:hypothetical protein
MAECMIPFFSTQKANFPFVEWVPFRGAARPSYILHWAERVTKQLSEKKFLVLCSRDEALKALGKNLHFSRDAGQTKEGALEKSFMDWWGAGDGNALSKRLLALLEDSHNPIRWCHQPQFENRVSDMTRDLEATIPRLEAVFVVRERLGNATR